MKSKKGSAKSDESFTRECFVALGQGLEVLFRPKQAPRVRRWLEDLVEDFKERAICDGKAEAQRWLVQQLRNPQLPDLRQGKSLAADRILVAQYRSMKEQLAQIFKEWMDNITERNKRAAPIIANIRSQALHHETLSTTRSLAQFCLETLDVDKVRLSRARKRVGQEAHKIVRI